MFCPNYQIELESRQKVARISYGSFRKFSRVKTDVYPTWRGCSPLPPTLMSIPALGAYADNIETRNNKLLLRLPFVRIETAKKSLYFQGPLYCFSELPIEIRSMKSIALFKSKVKEHSYLNKHV